MKNLILLSGLLCLSLSSKAQPPRVDWGAGVSGGAKFKTFDSEAPRFNPWGSLQLWAAGTIRGTGESSFALQVRAGVAYENVSYLSLGAFRFGTDHGRIFLNPEALLPLPLGPEEKGSVLLRLGFGLEYNTATRLWINGASSSDIMKAFYYGNLEYKERKLLPFLSSGLNVRPGPSFSVLIILKQYLQNAYYQNEKLDFGTGAPPVNLKHMPLCIQLGLLYHFTKA